MPYKDPQKKIDNHNKWRRNNMDKVRGYQTKWRENNREKTREINRRYARNNPDKIREKSRRRRRNSPDKVRAVDKRCKLKRTETAHKMLGPCAYEDKYCSGRLEFDHINGYNGGFIESGCRKEASASVITKVLAGSTAFQNLCHTHNMIKHKHSEPIFFEICKSISNTLMSKYHNSL